MCPRIPWGTRVRYSRHIAPPLGGAGFITSFTLLLTMVRMIQPVHHGNALTKGRNSATSVPPKTPIFFEDNKLIPWKENQNPNKIAAKISTTGFKTSPTNKKVSNPCMTSTISAQSTMRNAEPKPIACFFGIVWLLKREIECVRPGASE